MDLRSALLNQGFDVISICTSDNSHFSLAKAILNSSNPTKVIFLEKPACKTRKEFQELKVLAQKSDVLILVNHTRRFSKKYNHLRSEIRNNKFGKLNRVNAIYYGGWFHNGTHIVDTLGYLLDDIIQFEKVQGRIPSSRNDDPSLELSGHLVRRSARVNFSAIDENLYQLFDIDLWFDGGRLRFENFGENLIWEKVSTNGLESDAKRVAWRTQLRRILQPILFPDKLGLSLSRRK